jgi:hypothetical protein
MTRATRWFLGVAVAATFLAAGAPSCGSTATEVSHCCSNGMYYSCTSTHSDCPSGCSVVESKSATCQTAGGGGAGGAGGASPN